MEIWDKVYEKLSEKEEKISNLEFLECTFKDCEFMDMKLENCNWKDCVFEDCVIMNGSFLDCQMKDCRFVRCILVGVQWPELVRERSPFLPFQTFQECRLKYNGFYQMDLRGFRFDGSSLEGSSFEKCRLKKASFKDCVLKEVIFSENDLRGCDFRNAAEVLIDVRANQMRGAKFSYDGALNLLAPFEIVIE